MGRFTVYLWQRAAILAVAIVVGWIADSFFIGLAVAVSLFFVALFAGYVIAFWRR